MTTISKICLNCETPFEAQVKEVSRGFGKYCTRKCSWAHTGLVRKEQNIKTNIPNTSCTFCTKPIYVTPKRIKSSKHGVYFCCREHKDLSLRKESGINVALPSNYKVGVITDYRTVYMRAKNITSCEVCGYNKIVGILEVHHKDRNRDNNELPNLIALCPTCHMEEHYLNDDGKWKPKAF